MLGGNVDILLRLPDVAAIGRTKLQDYCNEWLQRPIAREYGITHLILGSNLLLTVNVDSSRLEFVDNRAWVPIFELLDYIIDQHFNDLGKRRELHAAARDIRQQWADVGYQYMATAKRVGYLWLTCKNPACDFSLETTQQAVEGQVVHCPPCQITCPMCGHTDVYDGSDLHVRLPQQ